MKITDNQDMRLELLHGVLWRYAKRVNTDDDRLFEIALRLSKELNEGLAKARLAGSTMYKPSRHLAVKALIKELETGEPVTDPVVQVATEKLERIGDSIFMRKVK